MNGKKIQKNTKIGCDPSINQFAEMIAAIKNKKAEKVPEGFKTSAQWADERGRDRSDTIEHINEALKYGYMEMQEFYVKQARAVRKVKHYRILKTK